MNKFTLSLHSETNACVLGDAAQYADGTTPSGTKLKLAAAIAAFIWQKSPEFTSYPFESTQLDNEKVQLQKILDCINESRSVKICPFFCTQSGCRHGDKCRNIHTRCFS
jgi:hypothetical protein